MPRESLDPDGDVVVKKVKMPRELAEDLKGLAAASGETESELLRQGIELVKRQRAREAAHAWLLRMAEEDLKRYGGKPPKKIYPRGR